LAAEEEASWLHRTEVPAQIPSPYPPPLLVALAVVMLVVVGAVAWIVLDEQVYPYAS
jgi:hypothetical protein